MELRPGCKQTKSAEIPEDWADPKLEDIARSDSPICYGIVQVGPPARSGVPVLAIKNLNSDYATNVHRASAEIERPYTRSRVRPDDVLISIKGTTGRIGLVPAGFHGNISRDLARLRLREGVSPTFCLQMLQSTLMQRRLEVAVVGTTRMELSIAVLKQVRLPLPPTRAEQETIAEALNDADALIESLEQLIAKKRDIKQAAMQQLLTGKQRLPGFSGEWDVKRFEDVADVDSDNLGNETPLDYAFSYISLEDVDVGSLRGFSTQVFGSAPSRARRRLRAGDVLVSTVRPSLQSHLLFTSAEPHWVCSTGFSVVRCKNREADPAYVFFHLFADDVTKQVEALLTGSNYPAISGRGVKALMVPIPTLPEQTAIATVLSDMDAEIAALEQRRDKTRNLKQGMMQELLTGRIRLV